MIAATAAPNRPSAPRPIEAALLGASRATGVPFDYLLRTAERESNFDPAARARASSATGLFQFLEQTWLGILRETGARHGYAREAAAIERRADGRHEIENPTERRRVLALRLDPTANAVMAGEFSRRNGAELERALGRAPTQGELYAAHVLGAAGAARLLALLHEAPSAPAAAAFPEAAQANGPLFYERGRSRSIAEFHARLTGGHGTAAPILVAMAGETKGQAIPLARDDGPVFHSLFRAEGRGPVSSLVRGVWGGASAAARAEEGPEPTPFFPAIMPRATGPAPSSEAPVAPRPPEVPALPQPPARAVRPRRPLDLLAFTRPPRG